MLPPWVPLEEIQPCRNLRFHFPIFRLVQNWLSQWQCWNEHLSSEQPYLLCLLAIHYSSQRVCSLRGWYRIRILDIKLLTLYGLNSVLKIYFIKDLHCLWQRVLWNVLSTILPEVKKLPFILKFVNLQKPAWDITMKFNFISHRNLDKISCVTHTHCACIITLVCSCTCSQDASWGFRSCEGLTEAGGPVSSSLTCCLLAVDWRPHFLTRGFPISNPVFLSLPDSWCLPP